MLDGICLDGRIVLEVNGNRLLSGVESGKEIAAGIDTLIGRNNAPINRI